jgi:hypothetical protein
MTQKEHDTITAYCHTDPWNTARNVLNLLKTVQIVEEPKGTRTNQQSRAMHLWFRQIAEACQQAGIDAKLLMAQTMSVEVNEYVIKGMWHAMSHFLFGKSSTRDLAKIGEIDTLEEHFVRFFGEKMHITLPPFPHDKEKQKSDLLEGMKIDVRNDADYPELVEMPTI